jgi:hypothetical protein
LCALTCPHRLRALLLRVSVHAVVSGHGREIASSKDGAHSVQLQK